MNDLLYVANAGEDTISVISTQELRETKRICLKGGLKGPRRLLYNNGMLYFTNSYASSVGRIDLSTGKQSELIVGAYPSGLCKCGNYLLVCCGETNNVWRIDYAKWRVEAFANTGVFPVGICAVNEGALVCCLLSCEVLLIDTELHLLAKYPLPSMPLDAMSVGGETYFSALETDGGGCLVKFDAKGGQIIRSTRCPAGRICPLGQQNKAVAAHLWDNDVSIVDCMTLNMESTMETAAMPDDIVCDACGSHEYGESRMYVSCMLGDCVDVLQSDGKLIARIPVGREPRGLALAAQTPPFSQTAEMPLDG